MKVRILIGRIVVLFLLIAIMVPFPAVEAVTGQPMQSTAEGITDLVLSEQAKEAGIGGLVINGPPEPPAEYAAERAASMVTSLDRAAVTLPNFPSYDWVFGCSAVSAAMISAYYDRNGYSNMYTGPTNGGVMPLSDQSYPYSGSYIWSTWNDGSTYGPYPNNPLVASHNGVDGLSVRGSIDDYWVQYDSSADDPYITGSWPQHTWGTAVGDYMKTSQSTYKNTDGSTVFYNYNSNEKLFCNDMESMYDSINGFYIDERDGTYGRKLFYEERGYTVTECYSQETDNQISGGFDLADFQAEIDAGHPVLLNLWGHSIVGYGYDDSTIYIRDTWDSNPDHNYWMTWGGSYSGMTLYSVSIVHPQLPPPGAFSKTSPSNGATNQWSSLTLTWGSSSGATSYEYCYYESGGSCTTWTSTGANRSVAITGLDPLTTYYWQVRANNSAGTTYANGSEGATWSFTTYNPADIRFMYLPYVVRD